MIRRLISGCSITAPVLRRVHLTMMCVWAALVAPSLLLWRDSVPWLVFMSLYANFVGHFSSWQGARSEDEASDGGHGGS